MEDCSGTNVSFIKTSRFFFLLRPFHICMWAEADITGETNSFDVTARDDPPSLLLRSWRQRTSLPLKPLQPRFSRRHLQAALPGVVSSSIIPPHLVYISIVFIPPLGAARLPLMDGLSCDLSGTWALILCFFHMHFCHLLPVWLIFTASVAFNINLCKYSSDIWFHISRFAACLREKRFCTYGIWNVDRHTWKEEEGLLGMFESHVPHWKNLNPLFLICSAVCLVGLRSFPVKELQTHPGPPVSSEANVHVWTVGGNESTWRKPTHSNSVAAKHTSPAEESVVNSEWNRLTGFRLKQKIWNTWQSCYMIKWEV